MILRLSFHNRARTASLPIGFEVAFEEIPYARDGIFPLLQSPAADHSAMGTLEVIETPTLLMIQSLTASWTFSPHDGQICDFKKNGVSVFASGPQPTFSRPQTDNDKPDGAEWLQFRLHQAVVDTKCCNWELRDSHPSEFIVEATQRFAPPALPWSIYLRTRYTFNANGTVSIRVVGEPQGTPLPRTLPRIGLTMALLQEWGGEVTWYGRGPGESYSDKKLSQRVGVHSVPSVDALWTDYEYPQEGGNRTDTRWVRFTHGPSGGTVTAQFVDIDAVRDSVRARAFFDFQASHYHCRDVDEAKYPHKLRRKKTEEVILRLDARHHGLGSGACGPKTYETYALRMEPFEFELVLV